MSYAKLYYGGESYQLDDAYVEDVSRMIRDALVKGQGAWVRVPLVASKSVTVLVTPGTAIAIEQSPYDGSARSDQF